MKKRTQHIGMRAGNKLIKNTNFTMEFLSDVLFFIAAVVFIAGIMAFIAEEKKYRDKPTDWHFKKKELTKTVIFVTLALIIAGYWIKPTSNKIQINHSDNNVNSDSLATATDNNAQNVTTTNYFNGDRTSLIDSLKSFDVSYSPEQRILTNGEESYLGTDKYNDVIEFIGPDAHLKSISWLCTISNYSDNSNASVIAMYYFTTKATGNDGADWLSANIKKIAKNLNKNYTKETTINSLKYELKFSRAMHLLTFVISDNN